ncbi:hypothetical protein Cob_v010755 [Colletotrichum orbiculare MAFF 240422]|uniref:Uncharacterized protein n=1 Tax=Colletotrichum orbiculare (strain 104-T / ATCC 96160 / CBS 514.97 / LARS 414 / MAFF 240422) TaxID=1213857 RepID=A0A484FF78_COLOR|nr:hypothetical protein Cob_v010755 [Colletotrichum orbiculare MAFF 240422]
MITKRREPCIVRLDTWSPSTFDIHIFTRVCLAQLCSGVSSKPLGSQSYAVSAYAIRISSLDCQALVLVAFNLLFPLVHPPGRTDFKSWLDYFNFSIPPPQTIPSSTRSESTTAKLNTNPPCVIQQSLEALVARVNTEDVDGVCFNPTAPSFLVIGR